MITINYLKDLISPIVATYEDHITQKVQVQLPYVVLLEMSSDNMFADNHTFQEIVPIQIILHQAIRNYTLEASIKNVLNTNHIPYNYSTDWDNDYSLYITTFDING